MKFHGKPLWVPILCIMISIFACVTINIYFPAEKVESVAGEIVDEIRGRKPADKDKQSKNQKAPSLLLIKIALSPSVSWAQDVTTVSNPTIRALKQKMKTRFAQMKPFYQKGMLNEGDNGYVSPGNTKGLGLKEKRDLKNFIDAENRDRKRLYQEVANALKVDPGQISRVAEIFAKEWQKAVQ